MFGLDGLTTNIDSLKQEARYKGGRFALRKAAQVVRDAARQNSARIDDPETAASIERNITERWASKLYKSTGDLGFRVGVLGGAGGSAKAEKLGGLPGGDTRHWRHVEFGTEKTPPRPILRPALAQNVDRATDTFVREFDKSIARAVKKGKA